MMPVIMPENNQVIFVDDEAAMRESMKQWLALADIDATILSSAEDARAIIDRQFSGVVLTDVQLKKMSGLDLLQECLAIDRDIPVVLLTGHGDVAMAVDAMKQGAYDFLEKPFDPDRLIGTVRRACEMRQLVLENRRLRLDATFGNRIERRLVGISPGIRQLRADILELAATPLNVVIRGETGTGKELVARCLHEFGPRSEHPFVAVNCGAIPETMFESEFFGHEQGAFTGAVGKRIGRLEYAHKGTLFLDEIESMPPALQVKVLRAFQEKAFERLGSHKSIPFDARIVVAAKVDLSEAVKEGSFREDLYYRLNVSELTIPPLRARLQDISLLFEHFVAETAAAQNRKSREITAVDLTSLLSHTWPGNVRELKNVAERFALGLSVGGKAGGAVVAGGQALPQSLANLVADFERGVIEKALLASEGNVAKVLEMLDIPRRTLNEKMTRYAIERKDYCRP
ncbi:C4-dicarboxylate transport transcriptional regulatory protein DctD [Afipia felis]|uniref:C4-dicarboxylate transport transcriptional regulatory protein DctD n=2 Tax=Nitrobacteraceae TaxID=41294 RepID=A0A090MGQ4_AFIFE|nr:C4-dicarboxylate transport transcriptional regulatory protein DctD [Afipia felis]